MQQLRLMQQAEQLQRQRMEIAQQQVAIQRQQEQQRAQAQEIQQLRHIQQQHDQAHQQRQQRQMQHREQQREQQQQQQSQIQRGRCHQSHQNRVQETERDGKEDGGHQQRAQRQIEAAQQAQQEERRQEEKERNPVVFHWSHGGKDVYVAYSGDNWSQKYRMHRSHNDFSLIMNVSPGVYHYKFIVDNQWRCAPDQKHVRDANGAYSNVLDVRSSSYRDLVEEQRKRRKKEREKAQFQYTQKLPTADHFVQDPPICPIHLHTVILNGKEPEESDDDGDGQSAPRRDVKARRNVMELPKPLRVSLNHLYVSDKREEEVVTLGMTERYEDKFFTTVYYTPIDSRGTMEQSFEVSNNYY